MAGGSCHRRAGSPFRRNAGLSLAQTECCGRIRDADFDDHTHDGESGRTRSSTNAAAAFAKRHRP